MGSVLFLGVSDVPTQRGRNPSALQFWGFLSIYVYILCRRITKLDVMTHMGWGLYLVKQPRHHHPKGAGSPRSPFGGSLLFMCTHFVVKLPTLTWQHMWGRGVYLRVSHASHPKTA